MKYVDFILKCFEKTLFPPHCLACSVSLPTGTACASCFETIPRNTTFFCAQCGARLPAAEKICHLNAPYLLCSAASYDNAVLRILIHRLKFQSVRRAAEPLADLLARCLKEIPLDMSGFLLVPLPLSRRRRNERGFNQSEEIAKHLAKRLPLEVRADILARHKHSKPQTETFDALERHRNVLGCFSVAKPDDVAGENIILLDDVTTSGATLGEAARALKAAGARKIIGLTAAKA